MTERWPAGPDSIERAAARLRQGAVIAFPTDTLYAVAALDSHRKAVDRLYVVKRRPASQPLVLLVRGEEDFGKVAHLTDQARDLMRRFWPGPLTLVLSSRLEPGSTIAGRAPHHPVALALLDAIGEPLASSSANRAGEAPPVDANSVMAGLGDDLDIVIDGGPCRLGIASTILDLSGIEPKVLRAGAISETELRLH